MEYLHYSDTPLGGILLSSDGNALTGLWFEDQRYYGATLNAHCEERKLPVFDQAETWLAIYFSGKDPGFTPPLAPKGTSFRTAVWDILLTIPFGKTRTYGEIAAILAEQEGKKHMSAQAVGGAVGHNPISLIIPCHRVIGADGSLVGFGGGLDRKRELLILEKSTTARSLNSSALSADLKWK